MIDLNNTQVAFCHKTNAELSKAYWMFQIVRNPRLVRFGSVILQLALKLRLPISWIVKPTVFQHFCGGVDLHDCEPSIQQLADLNIKTILDYSAEGIVDEKAFDEATQRILDTIHLAQNNKHIGFTVFKPTGIGRLELLEKIQEGKMLSAEEEGEFQRFVERVDLICKTSVEGGIPVMIDAEESWMQQTVDGVVEDMMRKYNREHPMVYNTLQMYRIDRLYYLKIQTQKASEEGYYTAFKLVRGAYLEKERERAEKLGIISPVFPDKTSTDNAYDEAVRFCIQHIDRLAVCVATHKEESVLEALHQMDIQLLAPSDGRVCFSQLLGMSDHISNNLALAGYHVSKYVPYGPVKMVMPYLIRRAEENTSVAGQTGRELQLLKKELQRRKKEQ